MTCCQSEEKDFFPCDLYSCASVVAIELTSKDCLSSSKSHSQLVNELQRSFCRSGLDVNVKTESKSFSHEEDSRQHSCTECHNDSEVDSAFEYSVRRKNEIVLMLRSDTSPSPFPSTARDSVYVEKHYRAFLYYLDPSKLHDRINEIKNWLQQDLEIEVSLTDYGIADASIGVSKHIHKEELARNIVRLCGSALETEISFIAHKHRTWRTEKWRSEIAEIDAKNIPHNLDISKNAKPMFKFFNSDLELDSNDARSLLDYQVSSDSAILDLLTLYRSIKLL